MNWSRISYSVFSYKYVSFSGVVTSVGCHCLGMAVLFYCGTLRAFHIIIIDIFSRSSPPKMNRNDPKFLDRYVWANSADPDQAAPRGAV